MERSLLIRADDGNVMDYVHASLHFNGSLQIWIIAEFYLNSPLSYYPGFGKPLSGLCVIR